jgi:hypothetical protein
MAGIIVVDRIESDASYASSINIASPIQISNTITGNVNFDSGTLFVDSVNNRVGAGTQNPSERLTIADGNMRHFLGTSGSTINATYTANTATDVYEIRANKIGAVGTNLALFTQTTAGSATERMRIDSSGRVTTPFQPAFFAGRTTGNVSINTAITFNEVRTNIGSCYNSDNGRFTAPIAGSYFFSAILLGNSASTTEGQIHKNGSDQLSGRAQNSASNSEAINIHGVMYLNANDFVDVRIGTGAIYGSEARTDNFSGFLIG